MYEQEFENWWNATGWTGVTAKPIAHEAWLSAKSVYSQKVVPEVSPREITIIVSGSAGAGKSTIANYIRDALIEVGVPSHVLDIDGSRPMWVGQSGIRLSDMNNKPTVTIKTAQTLRMKP